MAILIVQAYWYHDTVTGDFFYRIQQPELALNRDPAFRVLNVHVLHPAFPDLALAADLLICHMCAEPEIGPVIRQRRRDGRPTLFEISDHFLAPHSGISKNDPWRSPTIRERLLNHAFQADALQVSTHGLEVRYGGLNKATVVFENQIEHFVPPRLPQPQRVVIGWGGSMGHNHDLFGWKSRLTILLDRYPQLHLAFMCPKSVFMEHFGQFPPERVSFREPGPLAAYYEFLQTLDVGLAPAEDTPFNRCRSDGKFLEYAAHGVVPVLADVVPFQKHGKDGQEKFLYQTVDQGMAILEALLADVNVRRAHADAAFQYVKQHRDGTHLDTRVSFYKHLVSDHRHTAMGELPEAEGLMASLRLAHAEIDLGQYLQAEARLLDLLGVFPAFPQAQFALLECWWLQQKCAAIVDRLKKGGVPHAVYRDLSMAYLIRALRVLGKPGESAVKSILSDKIIEAELEIPHAPDALKKIAEDEPFRRDAMRSLLIFKSRKGALEEVVSITQLLDIIEDSVRDQSQDADLKNLFQYQIWGRVRKR